MISIDSTYPTMDGSIAMLPPITTKATAKVINTTPRDVRGSLGNRPRLNFNSSTAIGNNVMTASHIKENLSKRRVSVRAVRGKCRYIDFD